MMATVAIVHRWLRYTDSLPPSVRLPEESRKKVQALCRFWCGGTGTPSRTRHRHFSGGAMLGGAIDQHITTARSWGK